MRGAEIFFIEEAIPRSIRSQRISNLPVSDELASVLRKLCISTFHDLVGVSLGNLKRVSNNSAALFLELSRLIKLAAAGKAAPVSDRCTGGDRVRSSPQRNRVLNTVEAATDSRPDVSSVDLVSGGQPADPARAIANDGDDWLASPIFIPISERGRSLRTLIISVRLSNVFALQSLHLLGDLHGKTHGKIGRYRNCGRKTLDELRSIVRRIQLGGSQSPFVSETTGSDPNIISVSTEARSLRLVELAMPKRLENVLRRRRYRTIEDLHGCDLRELAKDQNCGRKTILQLKQLLRRAEAGEFTQVSPLQVELATDCSPSSDDALTSVIRFIDLGMSSVSERNREIVRQRLFGDKGGPRTLEDVGEQFHMSRERVRQIARDAFENVRRSGGPVLARALEAVANEQNAAAVPITAPLLAARLSAMSQTSEQPALFYVYVIEQIAPSIPVWGLDFRHEPLDRSRRKEINLALEKSLSAKGELPTAKEAFDHLRGDSKFGHLSVAAFFSALQRARRIIVDFVRAGEPRLRLRRLRLFDVALPMLADSAKPLTPEKSSNKLGRDLGADAVMLSLRTTENPLSENAEILPAGASVAALPAG